MSGSSSIGPTERRLHLLFAVLLVGGMMAAAWGAYTWPDQERERNLIVVAPDGTLITAIDGPRLIDQTNGVHTWSVAPGPLTLEVNFSGQGAQRTTIVIPKGLGGLMLGIDQNDVGELELAYF